jgi:hypothetical protein
MILTAQPAPRTRELNADGGHWYTTSGLPCHTVDKADGSGKRNTTLRDARKLGLYPSVTSISKMIANPSLDRWKQAQILKACIDSPRTARETEEFFKSRITQQAQKKMIDARAFGSQVHEAIDELNKTGFLDSKFEEVKPWIAEYVKWKEDLSIRFLNTEFTAINHSKGYAGQVDGLGLVQGKYNTLLDYKTQDYSEKPRWYESWPIQLAAYLNADWEGKPARIHRVMSVVICSSKPLYPEVRVWTKEELRSAWKAFQAANILWQITNKFDPAANAKEIERG